MLFAAGTLIIPFSYVLMWVSIFGNSAIELVRRGNEQFGQIAMNQPEQASEHVTGSEVRTPPGGSA